MSVETLYKTGACSSLDIHSVQTMKSQKSPHMLNPTSGGDINRYQDPGLSYQQKSTVQQKQHQPHFRAYR
jgi:hypothetical protein